MEENKCIQKNSSNYETLCWKCANAVPNADCTRGCPWSIDLKPVDGWNATKSCSKKNIYGLKDKYSNTWIKSPTTKKDAEFTCYSNAVKAIARYKLDPKRIKPEIMRVDEIMSYHVIDCPMFVRG